VWDASVVLARHLDAAAHLQPRPPALRAVARCVELGSGTGLAGIAAAACLQVPVVLTDLSEVLPALRKSVEMNAELAHLLDVRPLDWRDAARDAAQALQLHVARAGRGAAADLPGSACGADEEGAPRVCDVRRAECEEAVLVLAADCVWLAGLVQPLLDTLSALISTSSASASASASAGARSELRLLLAYKSRSKQVDGLLFEGLRRVFASVAEVPQLAGEQRGSVGIWLCTGAAAASAAQR
jgi:predicted nicotinamide N-methyase